MDFKKFKLPFGKKAGKDVPVEDGSPPKRKFRWPFGKKAEIDSASEDKGPRSFATGPTLTSDPNAPSKASASIPPGAPPKATTFGANAKKAKSFSSSKGEKFVLFIGDEGAILVYIKGRMVQSRQFVPDASPSSLGDLKRALANNIKAPITLVVDNMDQSYVQQTLPPVSSMSVGKLIKRRLDRDFGANDIKGAIVLGREKGGRKDWNFLMVALEKSPQLAVWLDFIMSLPNRFIGINLLSVETEIVVKSLEDAMGFGKKGTGAEWKFFVSHNKVGGFRQVILRNGRIIFTRLAQPVGESTAEVVAGSIEQEMLSTIEYMKRLSFNPQAGLDIYIVASSGIKSAIDSSKFGASSLHVLTPFEVAQYLRIEGATQATDQFGDVILAAIIGCSKKHVLTLQTPESRRINTYFPLIAYQRTGAVLAALALLGYGVFIGFDIYSQSEKTNEMDDKKTAQQRDLDAIMSESKKANIDIEYTNSLIEIYKDMLNQKAMPVAFIHQLEPMTQLPVWIKEFAWKLNPDDTKPTSAAPAGPGAPGAPPGATSAAPQKPPFSGPPGYKVEATLSLEFPAVTSDPNLFVIAAKKIRMDFQKLYPNFDVRYSQLPTGFVENNKKDIDFTGDDLTVTDSTKEPEAKLLIKELTPGSTSAPRMQRMAPLPPPSK
jgi:hypothetical protein